mmetsp:Transcript_24475/g.45244  ORF Transcript_24475/g.45244 Transcript_24475/m.45244 type:complete len:203 (-) Transcript_24475:1626-2234(-)
MNPWLPVSYGIVMKVVLSILSPRIITAARAAALIEFDFSRNAPGIAAVVGGFVPRRVGNDDVDVFGGPPQPLLEFPDPPMALLELLPPLNEVLLRRSHAGGAGIGGAAVTCRYCVVVVGRAHHVGVQRRRRVVRLATRLAHSGEEVSHGHLEGVAKKASSGGGVPTTTTSGKALSALKEYLRPEDERERRRGKDEDESVPSW